MKRIFLIMGAVIITASIVYSDTLQVDFDSYTLNAEFGAKDKASAVYKSPYLYITGGTTNDITIYADCWRSFAGVEWEAVTRNAEFGKRHSHKMLSYDNKLWVIGGVLDDGSVSNEADVWYSTDGVEWTAATRNAEFGTRDRLSAIVFDNKMWVIAGDTTYGVAPVEVNDVWYSTNGIDWQAATRNAEFPVRQGAEVIEYDNKMWIIGGTKNVGGIYYNDAWYSTDGVEWTAATRNAEFAGSDSGCLMSDELPNTYDIDVNGLYYYGYTENKIWFSTDGIEWTELTAFDSKPSDSRERAVAVTTKRTQAFLLGGYIGETTVSEVWRMIPHVLTATITPTATKTQYVVSTSTNTLTLTATPTNTYTVTPTFTFTNTFTATKTNTPMPTFTPTFTITTTHTITPTITATPTNTLTWTVSPTFSVTPTITATPTNTTIETPYIKLLTIREDVNWGNEFEMEFHQYPEAIYKVKFNGLIHTIDNTFNRVPQSDKQFIYRFVVPKEPTVVVTIEAYPYANYTATPLITGGSYESVPTPDLTPRITSYQLIRDSTGDILDIFNGGITDWNMFHEKQHQDEMFGYDVENNSFSADAIDLIGVEIPANTEWHVRPQFITINGSARMKCYNGTYGTAASTLAMFSCKGVATPTSRPLFFYNPTPAITPSLRIGEILVAGIGDATNPMGSQSGDASAMMDVDWIHLTAGAVANHYIIEITNGAVNDKYVASWMFYEETN